MAEPSLTKTFIAGGVGGACVVFIGHPLDTIKVRAFSTPSTRLSCTRTSAPVFISFYFFPFLFFAGDASDPAQACPGYARALCVSVGLFRENIQTRGTFMKSSTREEVLHSSPGCTGPLQGHVIPAVGRYSD